MQEIFLELVLICVVGRNALSAEQCADAATVATEQHRHELSVNWSIESKKVRNPFSRLNKLHTAVPLLIAWRGWFERRRRFGRESYKIAVTPPWRSKIGGALVWWYSGGYADATCAGPGARIAIAGATPRSPLGADRLWATPISIAHELGHLVGAEHDDAGCSTMHPAALACYRGEPLRFSARSVAEVRACLS